VREVLDIPADLVAMPDAPHRGYQAKGLIGLDHQHFPFGSLFPLLYLPAPVAVCTFRPART
jgi:hypothetical protein